MHTNSHNRDFALNVFVCALMFALTVGGIVYVIIRDSILEERYGKHNLLANTNLYESFAIAVVFLVAPLIGGFSAFRLAKSAKIIGWLLVVTFALFFLQAAMVEWTQYRNYQEILHR